MRGVRGAVLVVVVGAGCAWGTKSAVCIELFGVQPINETAATPCLGPPVPTPLARCEDPGKPQGHGITAICLSDATGAIYRASLTTTEWIEGTGWTWGGRSGDPGTLSSDAQARCAKYDLAGLPACQ